MINSRHRPIETSAVATSGLSGLGDLSSGDFLVGLRLCWTTLNGLSRLLVGVYVERDEKKQVRRQDEVSVGGGALSPVTGAHVWKVILEEAVGVVGVGGEIHENQIDQELDDLDSGDPLFPPNVDSHRRKIVVEVHQDVDKQVQSDDNPLNGGVADDLSVA